MTEALILASATSALVQMPLAAVTPEGGWTAWAVVALSISTIAFALRAMIAERRASTATQVRASNEMTVRLREIEDERADMGRHMAKVLAENTAAMTQIARSLESFAAGAKALAGQLELRPCQRAPEKHEPNLNQHP